MFGGYFGKDPAGSPSWIKFSKVLCKVQRALLVSLSLFWPGDIFKFPNYSIIVIYDY